MLRQQARLPEDLYAQIVAQPRQKRLIEQQPAELTAAKARRQQPLAHRRYVKLRIEHVGANAI